MIKAVLFDLDGTLLDSAPDLVATLNHLRSSRGLAAMPVPELRHFVSRGAPGLIKAGMPPSDEATFQRSREAFLQHYAENSFIETRPFDGVEALLAELQNAGIPWGIVTNKAEYLTFPIVERVGWMSQASVVICGDSVEFSKPHPAPVLAACQRLGVDPAQTLMVGDDIRDVEAGKRAGCHTALVTYGYATESDCAEMAGQTALIDAPGDVLVMLDMSGLVS
jgi:phosphoglycolate phosphatase